MTDKKRLIKVTIKIEKEVENEDSRDALVHYKTDGTRFETTNTMKLNVEKYYKVTFTLRPAINLTSVSLLGTKASFSETERDAESVTYTSAFNSTGLTATKRGKRDKVNFSLMLGDYGELLYSIQAKFYKSNEDNHVNWGNALHHIELECEASSHISIVKETFR